MQVEAVEGDLPPPYQKPLKLLLKKFKDTLINGKLKSVKIINYF